MISYTLITVSALFFLISKNSLKSAEGRNPSTREVYKGAPKKRTETNINNSFCTSADYKCNLTTLTISTSWDNLKLGCIN